MREIGGYFGLENCTGSEYHAGLTALNSGRNALAYLLRAKKIRKLYLPAFLCDSVSGVCAREGCAVEFYPIHPDFTPAFEGSLAADEWLYVVNFYGQISNEQAAALKEKWSRLIFDNVHAFFQRPVPGIDTLYSCRKFFGVPDGAYLATDAVLALDSDVSMDRMRHILGRYEGIASDYYADFKANDHAMIDLDVKSMSPLTHNLLRAIDYEATRQKRNENYALLAKALGAENPLPLTAPDGPYCYPFYCANGMAVKQQLAQQRIYVATLWPNVLDMDGWTLEKDYAQNILPLPCDQRYDAEDMNRIIRSIKNVRELTR